MIIIIGNMTWTHKIFFYTNLEFVATFKLRICNL